MTFAESIAQNPDISDGMTRTEIEAAIARHAESETLFDRPYEDKKTVRVSGPFTVESLSPHRVLADTPRTTSPSRRRSWSDSGRFVASILENLRRAGVQNTRRGERLAFLRLDPYPGTWLHGIGEYTEGGTTKTVAVAIGPEFGTVGPELVRDAPGCTCPAPVNRDPMRRKTPWTPDDLLPRRGPRSVADQDSLRPRIDAAMAAFGGTRRRPPVLRQADASPRPVGGRS